MSAPETLKRTALYDIHVALGAKMVPFAGYEMPVQYPTGITAEHNAVRTGCGIFDVSHMGEFSISGEQSVDFANYVTTNDVSKLESGGVHYTTICRDNGTIVDDALVYRIGENLMLVVNASNITKDWNQIHPHLGKFKAEMTDESANMSLIALQGPRAIDVLKPLINADVEGMKYYNCAMGVIGDIENIIVSRTGYTGEDGFELYVENKHAAALWKTLTAKGDVVPCGLGARDTLRLEMGMALYGNDIDDTVTPLEANLAWLVKLQSGPFIGRDALVAQKAAGVTRKLVGFTLPARNVPRAGMPVYVDGTQFGTVRSGTVGPSVQMPIGTCYLPTSHTAVGSTFEVDIRGTRVPATVTALPFWTKGSVKK